eukprot:COSAG01_NODE_5475_length_4236_cov_1111.481267_2_plen_161_part_00
MLAISGEGTVKLGDARHRPETVIVEFYGAGRLGHSSGGVAPPVMTHSRGGGGVAAAATTARNSLLPHGNDSNRGERPRLACFITMAPSPHHGGDGDDDDKDRRRRQRRVVAWREQLAAEEGEVGDRRENLAVMADADGGGGRRPAKLTALGEKLLGLTSW